MKVFITALILVLVFSPFSAQTEEISLAGDIRFSSHAGEPPGPRIITPLPSGEPGWRFEFEPGSPWQAGYSQIPIDAQRLRSAGFRAFVLEYRAGAASGELEIVLVGVESAYRAPLRLRAGGWRRAEIPVTDFVQDVSGETPPATASFHWLRFEASQAAPSQPYWLEVRHVGFLCEGDREERAFTAETALFPVPAAGRDPFFPCGVFLLGANRSLLDTIALMGANAVVEYGTAHWHPDVAEDHLEYARCAGVRVGAAVTGDMHGRLTFAESRLARLRNHPALLAWYLFDEPDGGPARGLPADVCSVERLLERRATLRDAPVLVTCLDSFGLHRYAQTADLLAMSFYWPAWGHGQLSLAFVHSAAAATVQIAAERGRVPLGMIQLHDHAWNDDAVRQDPELLRAQLLAELAAGVRGVFFFQGAAAIRLADTQLPGRTLWESFLDLAAEVATLAPLAARWRPLPGELELEPTLGEVRAAAFAEGDARWLALVNLGAREAEIELSGEVLREAAHLEDPRDAWSSPVRDGVGRATLPAGTGRVVRVVRDTEPAARASILESALPFSTGDTEPLRFDRAILGATLYPDPGGQPRLWLDGRELTADSFVHHGAAAVIRTQAKELTNGTHRVRLAWIDATGPQEKVWTFAVEAPRLPLVDDFERTALGDAWIECRDIYWNQHDPNETLARGSIEIARGELHILSSDGSLGVVLRGIEAPEELALSFTARLPVAGSILIERHELFREVVLPAGVSRVLLLESPRSQRVLVAGSERGRWTPPRDQQGGIIGIGVPPGGEAFFDELELVER